MDDELRSYFSESEQEEIVNTIAMMPVLPVNDIATFDKFIRWVRRWYKAATDIEVGYRLDPDSYKHAIDLRPMLLAKLMDLVTDTTASKIQTVIQEADDIYFEATVPLKNPESDFWHHNFYDKQWWRKPKILIGSLKEYYDGRGID